MYDMSRMMSLRMDERLYDRLQERADQESRSVSNLVVLLLEESMGRDPAKAPSKKAAAAGTKVMRRTRAQKDAEHRGPERPTQAQLDQRLAEIATKRAGGAISPPVEPPEPRIDGDEPDPMELAREAVRMGMSLVDYQEWLKAKEAAEGPRSTSHSGMDWLVDSKKKGK